MFYFTLKLIIGINHAEWCIILRWPNTVSACALADAIQTCETQMMISLIQQSFYLLNARSIFAIFLCNWMQCVGGLSFCSKGMLEKVTTQRTQQFSAFVCFWKNLVKWSACAVAWKIETDFFCRNLQISNDPVIRISRNLAKNSLETTWMIYHEKSEFRQ